MLCEQFGDGDICFVVISGSSGRHFEGFGRDLRHAI